MFPSLTELQIVGLIVSLFNVMFLTAVFLPYNRKNRRLLDWMTQVSLSGLWLGTVGGYSLSTLAGGFRGGSGGIWSIENLSDWVEFSILSYRGGLGVGLSGMCALVVVANAYTLRDIDEIEEVGFDFSYDVGPGARTILKAVGAGPNVYRALEQADELDTVLDFAEGLSAGAMGGPAMAVIPLDVGLQAFVGVELARVVVGDYRLKALGGG